MNTSGCRSSSVSTMSPNGVLCTVSDDRLRLAERLAADRARVLERHRVALLRHDAARLHEAVAEAAGSRTPTVHQSSRSCTTRPRPTSSTDGRRDALEQVVDRRDAAVGVAGRAVEAEQLAREVRDRSGKPVPVMAQAPSGLRLVRREAPPQPHGVALELLDDRQQVVRDRRRLRPLRVRVRRRTPSRGAGRRARAGWRAARASPSCSAEDELALPHPVHRHVDVVAAAGGVQPAGDLLAAAVDQQALDVEEEILVGAVVGDVRDCRRSAMASSASRMRRASAGPTMPASASITRCA